MRYEISQRIKSNSSDTEILQHLESQFRKVANKVERNDHGLLVQEIVMTFGSINRKDKTFVSVQKKENGTLVVAQVNYEPSFMFWIILLITLFSWIGWIIPIGFYLYQKNVVKEAIESVFRRVTDEVES